MKNEQKNTQGVGQNQDTPRKNINQQGSDSSPSARKTDDIPSSSQKSNISVNNEGKIGQTDQWTNQNKNEQTQGRTDQNQNNQQSQVKNNKTVTEPEIDAPIYDPEKTEKKIPQMQSNKNSK